MEGEEVDGMERRKRRKRDGKGIKDKAGTGRIKEWKQKGSKREGKNINGKIRRRKEGRER